MTDPKLVPHSYHREQDYTDFFDEGGSTLFTVDHCMPKELAALIASIPDLLAKNESLKALNVELVKALEFYASDDTYKSQLGPFPVKAPIKAVEGNYAKIALAKAKEVNG